MLCHLLTRQLSLYFNTSTHLEGGTGWICSLIHSLSIYPVLTLSYVNRVSQNTLYIPGVLRSAPWGLHAESQKKYSSSSQNSKFLRNGEYILMLKQTKDVLGKQCRVYISFRNTRKFSEILHCGVAATWSKCQNFCGPLLSWEHFVTENLLWM